MTSRKKVSVLILLALLWGSPKARSWHQTAPCPNLENPPRIEDAGDPLQLAKSEKDDKETNKTKEWDLGFEAELTNYFLRETHAYFSAVVVEDDYVVLDPTNPNRKTWEYIYHGTVDPKTGAHLAPEYQGQYYVFPRRAEKKTYVLRASYLKGIPLSFQREEQVAGLKTYLFTYAGRVEYTETYAGTAEFPGIAVKPGEEIRCADDELVYKTWVEPVTGEALKIEESCLSGRSV